MRFAPSCASVDEPMNIMYVFTQICLKRKIPHRRRAPDSQNGVATNGLIINWGGTKKLDR
jgi:hypothetical protein